MSDSQVRIALVILRTIHSRRRADIHRLSAAIDVNTGRLLHACHRLDRVDLLERTETSEYRLTDAGAVLAERSLRLARGDRSEDGFRWTEFEQGDDHGDDDGLAGLLR